MMRYMNNNTYWAIILLFSRVNNNINSMISLHIKEFGSLLF